MREICRGDNVDLGTAASFRTQWEAESGPQAAPPTNPIPLLLRAHQAPGDAVSMTAAVYSLHRAHPGKYRTSVDSLWPEIFAHNPDVSVAQPGAAELRMNYPAVSQSNERSIHFMQSWCEFMGSALGVHVPLLTNRPHIYFDPATAPPRTENFWVVCSGGKGDFTNKLWGHGSYQEVVDRLGGTTRFVQVGAAADDHPRLLGAEDMVGKTSLRELFELVRRARGVLCGVSLLMHVAAALERPAVVVAGGREPTAWNVYPYQQYVHTVGVLQCHDAQGRIGACWRSRVVPVGDGTALDRDTCEYPVGGLPLCMTIIRPSEVADKIRLYNRMRT